MNILQILPKLESGGVETGTIDLSRELVKRSHKVVVVSAGGRLLPQLSQIVAKHFTLDVHKKSLFSVFICSYKLAKIIKDEQIDIVHARSRVPAWVSFFALKQTSAVFITTCHGYYKDHFFSRVMGWGKLVIVISQVVGRHMINDFHVPKERIRLIYRGVDLEAFTFRQQLPGNDCADKVIGIVGRITPIKGHMHFIKALPNIISEFPKTKALIIGDAPAERKEYLNELKMMVEQLKLTDKVEFLGNVTDVPGVLKQLDVLVMATITEEAFGRVVIEAGAVGVPVVATRVGGVVEIIEHEKNGLLVDPAQPNELSQAVIRLLKDKKLAKCCQRNLKKKVDENFSLSTMVNKTIAVYDEAIQRKRILVIKLGALGDVILIGPALKALRARFPLAAIEVLIKNEFKDILQKCPYIDNLIILRSKKWGEIIKKIFLLKKKGFDAVVDLQNNTLSHCIAYFAGIRQRYGYKNKKMGFLLNRGILDTAGKCNPVEHQFRVLSELGIRGWDNRLEMWISDYEKEEIQNYLAQNWCNANQPLIGINPIASSRWQTKIWPLARYAKLVDMLAKEFNARIIFMGMEKDAAVIEQIISLSGCKPINAAGKTSLMQLAALIKACSVLVTPDSAPMHIAAAVGTPFVALFGPTDPERHLPNSGKFVLIKKDLTCSPCYRPRCFSKKCMNDISVEEVFKAVAAFLPLKQSEEL